MGKGIDAAREDAPLHAAILDDFKDQFLIVLVRRLGGKVNIPITELDDTGGLVMLMAVNENNTITFELQRKQ